MKTVQGVGGTSHSIDSRYRVWIERYEVEHPTEMRGWCRSVSEEMAKEFDGELVLVRGFVVGLLESSEPGRFDFGTIADIEDGHFWLETKEGHIVDPTMKQFRYPVAYQAFDESRPEILPMGKCYNCGEHVYTKKFGGVCSQECYEEYRAYLMSC